MTSVLDNIVAATREAVRHRRERYPLEQLRGDGVGRPGPWEREHRFHGALAREGISVIAEFKRRSPSAGAIREGSTVGEIVGAYERGGAAAVSVLTEEAHFAGSLQDLRDARAATDLPLLRKDFMVDAYQLHEARAAGADAILLIVAALSDADLHDLKREADTLALDVLVEVHDRAELDRALALSPRLLGINNRDLRDFSVDVRRTFALLAHVPPEVTVVSESGIGTPAQLCELAAAGVGAVLVGESLMRAADPQTALARLRGGGPVQP